MTTRPAHTIRSGSGEPLVLLHGILGSARMWRYVVPLLAEHHDTVAMTALGHRGGPAPTQRPARIAHLVDDVERRMDELGFDTAHIAGNSMGGWLALELARRGRARTVTAFSPAGTLETGVPEHDGSRDRLRRIVADTRRSRRMLPYMARSKRVRRFGLRENALLGERVRPRDFVASADDVLGCLIAEDILSTPETLAPLDPPPCPIMIAWARGDRILSLASNGERARERVPGADFRVFDHVGHVPMFDDPEWVAATILEVTGAGAR